MDTGAGATPSRQIRVAQTWQLVGSHTLAVAPPDTVAGLRDPPVSSAPAAALGPTPDTHICPSPMAFELELSGEGRSRAAAVVELNQAAVEGRPHLSPRLAKSSLGDCRLQQLAPSAPTGSPAAQSAGSSSGQAPAGICRRQ